MQTVRSLAAALVAACVLSACPGGTPEPDAGEPDPGPEDAGEPDPGPEDAGEPDPAPDDAGAPATDGGTPANDGGTPANDAGTPANDAGSPSVDAGTPATDAGSPPFDAGAPPFDAGPPIVDEAGDLEAPLDVTLPVDETVDLNPRGDRDCVRFTLDTPAAFTAAADVTGTGDCAFTQDPELFLYASGATDPSAYLVRDDDDGPGACPLLEVDLVAGTYVLCLAHASDVNPFVIPAVQLTASATPYVCGDDTLDPGEECDTATGCTDCLLDDGLRREDETLANDTPTDPGVLSLVLDERARGRLAPAGDVDVWALELPGGLGRGALALEMTGVDPAADPCLDSAGLVVELVDATTGIVLDGSGPDFACDDLLLTSYDGAALTSDESLLVRVRHEALPSSYTLLATYVPNDCGNGALEPAEECELGGPLDAVCDPATCLLVPPVNDTCANAAALAPALDGTPAVASGVIDTATDTTSGTCQPASGAARGEVFIAVTPPGDGRLALDLNADFGAALYVLDACGGTETSCVAAGPRSLVVDAAAATPFVVVVDSTSAATGDFSLTATYLPTPDNDTCLNATPFTVPTDGSPVGLAGDTRAAASDDAPDPAACPRDTTGPDVHYAFTADVDARVVATLDADAPGATLRALAGDCSADLACVAAATQLELDVTAGEDYILVVENAAAFDLTVFYALPPPNDVCATATVVNVPTDGSPQTVSGNTTGASFTAAASCAAPDGTGRDVFFEVVSPSDGVVAVELTPTFDSTLFALDACGGTETACDDAPGTQTESLSLTVSAGVPTLVGVTGFDTAFYGAFDLTLTFIETLNGGDTCEVAVPLPGPAGGIIGTLDGYTNVYDPEDVGDCTGFSAFGNDVIYSIELPPGATFTADFTADLPETDEVLYLLDACPPVADSCVDGEDNGGGSETVTFTNNGAAAQTYFLVVDEWTGFSGGVADGGLFTLTWDVTGP